MEPEERIGLDEGMEPQKIWERDWVGKDQLKPGKHQEGGHLV